MVRAHAPSPLHHFCRYALAWLGCLGGFGCAEPAPTQLQSLATSEASPSSLPDVLDAQATAAPETGGAAPADLALPPDATPYDDPWAAPDAAEVAVAQPETAEVAEAPADATQGQDAGIADGGAPTDAANTGAQAADTDTVQGPTELAGAPQDTIDVPTDAIDAQTDGIGGLMADALADAVDASPVVAGLQLTVNGALPGKVNLHVVALPAAALLKGGGPDWQSMVVLGSAPAVALPWSATLTVPAGQWGLAVAVGPVQFSPTAMTAFGFGCAGGQPAVVQSDGAATVPAAVEVTVKATSAGMPLKGDCSGKAVPDPNNPLSQTVLELQAEVAPPSTQAGGAHLLSSVWVGGALWVAGHQDAFVRFDFPVGGVAAGIAGWQPQGSGECSRMFRIGGRLWCSSRRMELPWAQVSVATGEASAFGVVNLPLGALADGLAAVGDRILVAAHGAGLVSIQADPPFGALALSVDGKLSDPWDVAAVGASVVVVADGAAGLKVFTVGNPLSLTLAAALPLPGVSALLAVQGTQVAVTSPTGHLYIVDVAQPSVPKVQLAWQAPGALGGLTVLLEAKLGVVAAGGALIAFDWPAAAANWDAPVVRDVERVWSYVLDVDPLGSAAGNVLLTSEFSAVRQLKVLPGALGVRTLHLPKAIFAKTAGVGAALATSLTLRNLGSQPVQVTEMTWHEDPKSQEIGKPVGGVVLPLTVPPGAKSVLSLTLPKTIKGGVKHEVRLETSQGQEFAQVVETTHLQPGDALPKLAFQTASGELIDINKSLAGKPGVVVVAAHACPVALVALAAIARLVEPWVAQGKLQVVAIEPWDKPVTVPQMAVPKVNFPIVFTPLTTGDNHAYSIVLQDTLAQPTNNAAQMPLVYVVDSKGIIVDARLGWEPAPFLDALSTLGVKP